jgi:hypothetical protein
LLQCTKYFLEGAKKSCMLIIKIVLIGPRSDSWAMDITWWPHLRANPVWDNFWRIFLFPTVHFTPGVLGVVKSIWMVVLQSDAFCELSVDLDRWNCPKQ